MKTRNILVLLTVTCMMLLPVLGQAKDWSPKSSIKLQIGFGAGGSTDILGRLIAASVEESTGWNIVVENKPGGGGVAMFSSLMNQKPDGLKLGVGVNVPILLNLALRGDKLPFKIDSFDYIATITKGENAMVVKADAPYDNFTEFMAYAETQKAIAIGYDAKPQQMIMNAITKQSKLKFKLIKHKSGAEQIQSLLGGHITVACLAGAHIKYLKSGDLKMIAVYNRERHSYALNVKTLIEDGYNYYIDPYYYIAAPKGLPENIKAALAGAFDKAVYSEQVKEVLANTLKATPDNLGPAGTMNMLTDGAKDIKVLIEAGK
ncbi:MAG: tripartite tricarboxylate transporter substrate binding protein [Desulfobacteraceae bacterium]|nr:tripartite tricarboxylate transporter substrate binding protein [Desulfobacteraceae bacterium]